MSESRRHNRVSCECVDHRRSAVSECEDDRIGSAVGA